MQHGLDTEEEAAQAYLRRLETLYPSARIGLQPVGFFVHKEHCFIGASPDRLVIKDEAGTQTQWIVQIKCPYRYSSADMQQLPQHHLEQVVTELAVVRSHVTEASFHTQ